ncbi:MAG TPA: CHAT domain-containing protein [Nitrosomonas sp.]|nr:CHAT domain-containing protein [Nitrosomonas sp.]
MSIQLSIPGKKTSSATAKATIRGGSLAQQQGNNVVDTHLLDAVKELGTFDVSPLARESQPEPSKQEVRADDIIEFVLDSGISIWTSVAAYQQQQQRILRTRTQSTELTINPDLGSQMTSRGVMSDVKAQVVQLLRLEADEIGEAAKNPANWPDWIKQYGFKAFEELGARLAAKLIVWLIEQKAFAKRPSGLYRWVKNQQEEDHPIGSESIAVDKPLLLFIHGTGSSTQGSFGALHLDVAHSEWEMLTQTFAERIYAFEHPTLSVSPIDNALELAKALPEGADLSIVSHSRGGLVADLLCLQDLSADVLNRYNRHNDAAKEIDTHKIDTYDREHLAELVRVLKSKAFRIKRLIRVASPSQGTLLASENSDQFLSILTSLIGLIPFLGQSPIYQVTKRITLEAIKQRWDAEQIPGIEAMIPSSPLVALLNNPEVRAAGDLGVIAGDIEGSGWFKRLGVFISDTFIYESGDNDLVVNTDSMLQGLRRSESSRYVFDKGADVSHFRYFENIRTRRLVVQALSQSNSVWPPEFRSLEEGRVELVPTLRTMQKRDGSNQPVVFVLPGIMGSELKVGDTDVWLNYPRLFLGDLDKLVISAPAVTVTGLVGSYYRKLCSSLSDSHEVIPFGYDWRRSIKQAAALLAKEVERTVNRTDQPVRFVAHSMGGLVVRRFIQDFPDLWDTLCQRKGARVLMLGTPNHGSFDIVASLAGVAKTIKQLALLDFDHSLEKVVKIIAEFQGALELLPKDNELSYFTMQEWNKLSPCAPSKVRLTDKVLSDAKSTMEDLHEEIPHVECIRYVAGQASRTLSGVRIESDELVFQATTAGDGRVTYESGRLPNVPMWYAEAEHGDLSSYSAAFPAYRELLEQGETTLLPLSPPVLRGRLEETFDVTPESVLYPTPEAFEAGLLGRRAQLTLHPQPTNALRISVRHGDLIDTQHPIMVSHYESDTIAGPEKVVDSLVDGALSERYRLGRYPGRIGTVAVALTQQNQAIQHGAIVIGLGRWGELTPTRLTQVVQQAGLEYALHVAQLLGKNNHADKRELTICSLLIGSNTSANIAVEDSVNAIVRGIMLANRALLEKNETMPYIAHIEFVEIYQDAAADAVKAANRLKVRIERELNAQLTVDPRLSKGWGSQTRLGSPVGRGYWRRWTISAVPIEPAGVPHQLPAVLKDRLHKALEQPGTQDPLLTEMLMTMVYQQSVRENHGAHQLKFLALSDRARAEATVQATQPELVGQLLKQITRETVYAHDLSKTLFELLVPIDLKDSLLNQDRIVLIVDDVTANYPWELMAEDGQPLCIRMGMIRQLELNDYDAHVRDTTTKVAYVLGNPATPAEFPPLENARIEADKIAALLKTQYTVTQAPNQAGAMQVFNDLFAAPYRIIHIAGHGYYDESALGSTGARTGVVLNGGVFITATEIAKLDPVPELVFLNCCYLGQIDQTTGNQRLNQPYHKLAASISRELIRRGVRAVIAAGWPVDDEAAALFAEAFYGYLLKGQSFGVSVWQARKDTWEKHQNSNTWGAYQAYGDPDFRLYACHDVDQDEPVSADELLIELDRLARQGDAKKFVQGVKQLQERSPTEWFKQANVQERLGKYYGNFGQLSEAIRYYLDAIRNEGDEEKPTLRAVEQFINFKVRAAKKETDKKLGSMLLGEAIEYGEHLLKIGETSERLSIMGSAYKRLAELEGSKKQITSWLKKASGYYHRAEQRQQTLNTPDPYPMVNALMIDVILGELKNDDVQSKLTKGYLMAQTRFMLYHHVWDAIMVADFALIQAYWSGSFEQTDSQKDVKSLITQYHQAFMEGNANAKERDSACKQLSFLIDMLEKLKSESSSKKTIQALKEIRKALSSTAID